MKTTKPPLWLALDAIVDPQVILIMYVEFGLEFLELWVNRKDIVLHGCRWNRVRSP